MAKASVKLQLRVTICSPSMRCAAALVFALAALSPARANASAIGAATQQIASSIGLVPTGAIVIASALESDVPASPNRGDELSLRIASLLAGKIPGAHAGAKTATLDQARALASRSAVLVYAHVQIQKSQLRVTVDAYPVIRNVWDRARLSPPPPTAHAYFAASIDAEVRAFFPTIPLEMQAVHKATHNEGEVIAVACGDLDGDGGAEILLASRDRVSIGRMPLGTAPATPAFRVERSALWSALAKRAAVPLREPLGGAEIAVGRATVGTSDRGGVIVDDALGSPRATSSGIPIGAGLCTEIAPARLSFDGLLTPCDTAPPARPGARESFDAGAAFELVAPNGQETLALATRESGKMRLRVGGVEKAAFDGAGAQVTVLDADLDGTPEIAFSSDGPDDAITIATVGDHGTRVVNRIAAPAGVRALGACPSIDGGAGAIVAVVGSEVWLVR